MKAGDYVRTKEGIIDKVIIDYNGHCANPDCNCKHVSCVYNYYDEDTIVKSSANIIDLIEVGDYVNKKRVEWIGYERYEIKDDGKEPKGIGYKLILFNEFTKDCINEKGIKSIVTKEQFESMEYKL